MSSSSRSRSGMAVAFTLGLFAATASAQETPQIVAKGCFSNAGSMSTNGAGYYMYQSSGYCQQKCLGLGKAVMGLNNKSYCYCGDELPAKAAAVDGSECDLQCSGWTEMCGGAHAWTVYLTGEKPVVPYADGSFAALSSSSSSSSSSDSDDALTLHPSVVQPITVTIGGKTIISTITPTANTNLALQSTDAPAPSSTPTGGSSTGSKVGIAVGVVVGVLGLAALIGGVYFFMKKRKTDSTRHNRNPSFVGFSNQGSPPASMTDSRLDPTMVERRNSMGSIFADNEDYSRRILRVANPTS